MNNHYTPKPRQNDTQSYIEPNRKQGQATLGDYSKECKPDDTIDEDLFVHEYTRRRMIANVDDSDGFIPFCYEEEIIQ